MELQVVFNPTLPSHPDIWINISERQGKAVMSIYLSFAVIRTPCHHQHNCLSEISGLASLLFLVFVILGHNWRKVIYFNITENTTEPYSRTIQQNDRMAEGPVAYVNFPAFLGQSL